MSTSAVVIYSGWFSWDDDSVAFEKVSGLYLSVAGKQNEEHTDGHHCQGLIYLLTPCSRINSQNEMLQLQTCQPTIAQCVDCGLTCLLVLDACARHDGLTTIQPLQYSLFHDLSSFSMGI